MSPRSEREEHETLSLSDIYCVRWEKYKGQLDTKSMRA